MNNMTRMQPYCDEMNLSIMKHIKMIIMACLVVASVALTGCNKQTDIDKIVMFCFVNDSSSELLIRGGIADNIALQDMVLEPNNVYAYRLYYRFQNEPSPSSVLNFQFMSTPDAFVIDGKYRYSFDVNDERLFLDKDNYHIETFSDGFHYTYVFTEEIVKDIIAHSEPIAE